MKKIAMLNCLRANQICTGASCFQAFNDRTKSFQIYGEDTQLAAFMRCNGCNKPVHEDKGMDEKIKRLVKCGVETVHAGVCTKNREGVECKTITDIIELIEKEGIQVIRGTH